jgi:hypothetical protein
MYRFSVAKTPPTTAMIAAMLPIKMDRTMSIIGPLSIPHR